MTTAKLNLRLLAGLGAAVACLLLFAFLAEEVLHGAALRFDLHGRNAIHSHASAPLTLFFRVCTFLGSPAWLSGFGVVIAVWLAVVKRARAAMLFVVIMVGAALLDEVLKLTFHRTRPVAFFGLRSPHSYSFPSGHALLSCCFYGMLAAIIAKRASTGGKILVWCGAAVLVVCIGLSRIYLGVHYPTDVMAGYSAAIVWVAVVASLLRR